MPKIDFHRVSGLRVEDWTKTPWPFKGVARVSAPFSPHNPEAKLVEVPGQAREDGFEGVTSLNASLRAHWAFEEAKAAFLISVDATV